MVCSSHNLSTLVILCRNMVCTIFESQTEEMLIIKIHDHHNILNRKIHNFFPKTFYAEKIHNFVNLAMSNKLKKELLKNKFSRKSHWVFGGSHSTIFLVKKWYKNDEFLDLKLQNCFLLIFLSLNRFIMMEFVFPVTKNSDGIKIENFSLWVRLFVAFIGNETYVYLAGLCSVTRLLFGYERLRHTPGPKLDHDNHDKNE